MVHIQDIDLIQQFVDKYNSAQASIDAHNTDESKRKYKELLQVYNAIHASKLDKEHKDLAYDQVMKVYKGIHSVKMPRMHISKSVVLAGIVLLISLVIFIKPEIIGFAFDASTINQAPVWDSAKTVFNVRAPQTRINLDNYFSDADGDQLTYLATEPDGVKIDVSGSYIIITPDNNAYGPREVMIIASDGYETAKQRVILNLVQTVDILA